MPIKTAESAAEPYANVRVSIPNTAVHGRIWPDGPIMVEIGEGTPEIHLEFAHRTTMLRMIGVMTVLLIKSFPHQAWHSSLLASLRRRTRARR